MHIQLLAIVTFIANHSMSFATTNGTSTIITTDNTPPLQPNAFIRNLPSNYSFLLLTFIHGLSHLPRVLQLNLKIAILQHAQPSLCNSSNTQDGNNRSSDNDQPPDNQAAYVLFRALGTTIRTDAAVPWSTLSTQPPSVSCSTLLVLKQAAVQ